MPKWGAGDQDRDCAIASLSPRRVGDEDAAAPFLLPDLNESKARPESRAQAFLFNDTTVPLRIHEVKGNA